MRRSTALDEKLATLQRIDLHRKWYSLDDQRVCVLCDRIISGRMIDVRQDKRGSYELSCPTPGCPAGPRDWFYHAAAKLSSARVTRSRAAVIRFGRKTIA